MAKPISDKRPENFWKTLRTLLHYMGNHRFLLLAVAVLVSLSALANLLGTYMLKPIVNDYIIPRDVNGLIHAVGAHCLHLRRRCAFGLWLHADHGGGRRRRSSVRSVRICSTGCNRSRCVTLTPIPTAIR